MRTHHIDVSRNWREETIPAILVLKSTSDLDAKQALARFKRSVSQWLANTPRGKSIWASNRQDFNYGDFRENDVGVDPSFIEFLNANGIQSAVVDRFEAETCGETWDTTIHPETA